MAEVNRCWAVITGEVAAAALAVAVAAGAATASLLMAAPGLDGLRPRSLSWRRM